MVTKDPPAARKRRSPAPTGAIGAPVNAAVVAPPECPFVESDEAPLPEAPPEVTETGAMDALPGVESRGDAAVASTPVLPPAEPAMLAAPIATVGEAVSVPVTVDTEFEALPHHSRIVLLRGRVETLSGQIEELRQLMVGATMVKTAQANVAARGGARPEKPLQPCGHHSHANVRGNCTICWNAIVKYTSQRRPQGGYVLDSKRVSDQDAALAFVAQYGFEKCAQKSGAFTANAAAGASAE